MSERYEVKNINEAKNLSIDEIKNFNMNMLKKEANLGKLCGFNPDEGSTVRVGGNPEVEMLIVRKELGIDDDDELTPDAETILNQLKMIDVCEELDKYEYGINNLKELGKGGKLNKVKNEVKPEMKIENVKSDELKNTKPNDEVKNEMKKVEEITKIDDSDDETETDEEEVETKIKSSNETSNQNATRSSSNLPIILIIIISLIILSFVIYFFIFRNKNKLISKYTSLGIF